MRFEVSYIGTLRSSDAPRRSVSPEASEAFLDRVMEALVSAGAKDPDIGATLASGGFEIEVVVDAREPAEAAALGTAQIMAAVEAAGAGVSVEWAEARAVRSTEAAQAGA